MRSVTCSSCGKRYDYDVEEFCPKCGSYTPPGDRRVRTSQPQPSRRAAARPQSARSAGARPVTPGPSRTRGARRDTWTDGEQRKPRRATLLAIIVIGVAISLLSNILPAIGRGGKEKPVPDRTSASSVAAVQPEGGVVEQELHEAFYFNGWQVTVEEAWEPDLPPSSALPEGRCVAVDLWIEGGERISEADFTTPCLILEDGTQVEAVDGAPLVSRQLKNAGVYDIVPADAQWEDPLYGQLVFFVPEDAAGSAELILPSAGAGEEDPVRYSLQLELPWQTPEGEPA